MKTLLITKNIEGNTIGGRELLSQTNRQSLSKILLNNLEVFEVNQFKKLTHKKILDVPKGYIDGMSKSIIKNILEVISCGEFKQIFIDGSNFGSLAKAIKKVFPELKIVTFFHNSECQFFFKAFVSKPSIHTAGVFFANYFAEKFSVNYSDTRICLNKRDSEFLFKVYKKRATHISSLCMKDEFKEDDLMNKNSHIGNNSDSRFLLFVGGNFYANINGIKWFLEKVAPLVTIKIKVVGRGLEELKPFGDQTNVEIVGEVSDLSAWYLSCMCVVAPIFSGSGMKTKVAEALMYGRKVIGTEESFTGYECFQDQIGWKCESVDDFINAIHEAEQQILYPFHESLRKIFIKEFSQQSSTHRLKKILQSSN